MKILISVSPCGLVEFYDMVAREMTYLDTSALSYDCTKINIAPNIQEKFYEFYSENAKVINPTTSEIDIRMGITLLLAVSGPKVDATLKANEVEIFDGFIC